jgi:hypothetical protein
MAFHLGAYAIDDESASTGPLDASEDEAIGVAESYA